LKLGKYTPILTVNYLKGKPGLSLTEQLNALLPYGMMATKRWLLARGMRLYSVDNALRSNKLTALAVGVYARAGLPVNWQGIAGSVQRMADQPVLVGGLSALELSGFGHYLSGAGRKTIHLYSPNKLPAWLNKIDPLIRFEWHGTKTLWPPSVLVQKRYHQEHRWRDDLPPILLSCPEKACLEMLADLPEKIGFEHADELMQGMTNLSPNKLQDLLGECKHVKVKRLFLWLAQRQDYPWFKKLTLDEVDLGKGKRVVAKQGKLDTRYQITVPEHMHGS
jgi:hypothetical protein